jgi:hypothetical protein
MLQISGDGVIYLIVGVLTIFAMLIVPLIKSKK